MSRLMGIQKKLLDTQTALARHQRALAADPSSRALYYSGKSLDKRNRELELEFLGAANDSGIDVCSYRLLAERRRPTAAGVAGTLGAFQHLVSVVYDAIKNGAKSRQALGADVIQETAFEFGYSFSGSVGIVLTLPNERLLSSFDTDIDETFYTIVALSEARDSARLAEHSRKLGLASIRATHKWASEHVRNGLGVGIDWQRNREIRAQATLQLRQLEELREVIAQTSDESIVTFDVTGELLGADHHPRHFHFRPDNGKEIRGKYEDAITPEMHPTLFDRYRATIKKTVIVHYSTEEENETYELVSLQPLGTR